MARNSDRAGGVAAPAASDMPDTAASEPEVQERTWRTLLRQFRPAIVLTLALTAIVVGGTWVIWRSKERNH